MSRVVVFAATRAYQLEELAEAARRLGVELLFATDRCHVLAEQWPEGDIAVDFADAAAAAERVVGALGPEGAAGAIGTDERTAELAAALARRLGLPHNPAAAVGAARDKLASRRALRRAGLPQPVFAELPAAGSSPVGYPAVIKPRCLSMSRGVMRVDDDAALAVARARLDRLLADPEVRGVHRERAETALIERFIPGPEVAYEGLLAGGELRRLAIFDKPDPLDGPFFAETLYVTPSRLAGAEQAALDAAVAAAAAALGLREGPVHAELRLGGDDPVVIEIAARSIGGLCGRTLRLAGGRSVEELVIAHAAGLDIALEPPRPAGVLMIPVLEAGILVEITGLTAAAAVPGIAEIDITARPGDVLVPLPEGNRYLGFAFARGDSIEAVTAALRRAGAAIRPRVRRKL